MGRPWFMEPVAADHWAALARQVFKSGSVPAFDKRDYNTYRADYGAAFRVDENGVIDKAGVIQVFRMNAPVAKYDYCGSPGSQTFIQMINAAVADPTVSSVLLWIDSPGGQVDGTESLAKAIKASTKPVVAFADGMMASASYWTGSSAMEIVADGSNGGWNTSIGSIGTMVYWEDDSKAAEMNGIVRHIIMADDSPDKWGDHFALQSGDYTRVKTELKGINDTFHAAVKSNRGDRLKSDEALTGKLYNVNEALKLGLIDKIGDFNTAVKRCVALAKSQKNTTMEKNVFQSALAAANAPAFAVVDGGFMVTEDQLTAVDARLAQDATTITALTAQLSTLQAQATAFAGMDTTKQALATAKADLAKVTADLTTTQAELVTANATIATLKEEPGGEFAGTASGKEAKHTGKQPDTDAFSHNKAVDEML